MIGGIFSFLGALLKAVPFVFLSWRGEIMRAVEAWRPRRERRLIRRILPLARIATLAIFLSGCRSAVFESGMCPTWPEAGPIVAVEIERGMMPQDQFPAFWGWMGRVDKLRDQLLACRKKTGSRTPCSMRVCSTRATSSPDFVGQI